MKRLLSLACVCALALALAACSGGNASSSQDGGSTSSARPGPSGSADVSGSQPDPAGSVDASGSQPDPTGSENLSGSQPGETQTATLYIGMDGQFSEYPVETSGEITPTLLVEEIARLTGWNLDLDDEVISGKGGMTVTFADTCALFVGPPDPQKDEFHVFSADELDRKILDSVKKTLQNWAVVPGLGDPDSVDIYFSAPGGGDLVLESIGVTIPCTEPYQSFPNPQ